MRHVTITIGLGVLCAALALNAQAQDQRPAKNTTHIDYTRIVYGPAPSDEEMAERWQLTPEEIKHYRDYMAIEGRYFYAHLDPVMVLGIIETDPDQRRVYAEQQLMQERERIEQQVSFASLIADAQFRLFGSEPLVAISQTPTLSQNPHYLAARARRDGKPKPGLFTPPAEADVAATTPTIQSSDQVFIVIDPRCQQACAEVIDQYMRTTEAQIVLSARDFASTHAIERYVLNLVEQYPQWKAPETRLQPRRYDPIDYAGVDTRATPTVVLQRDGVILATL